MIRTCHLKTVMTLRSTTQAITEKHKMEFWAATRNSWIYQPKTFWKKITGLNFEVRVTNSRKLLIKLTETHSPRSLYKGLEWAETWKLHTLKPLMTTAITQSLKMARIKWKKWMIWENTIMGQILLWRIILWCCRRWIIRRVTNGKSKKKSMSKKSWALWILQNSKTMFQTMRWWKSS
jgi:hypothetical protein